MTSSARADAFPDNDSLLRLAERIQAQNEQAMRATDDMIHTTARVGASSRYSHPCTNNLSFSSLISIFSIFRFNTRAAGLLEVVCKC